MIGRVPQSGNAICCQAEAPCKGHRRRTNALAPPTEHAAQAVPAARELQVARELLVIRELLDRAELREMCLQALAAAGASERRRVMTAPR
jgi:hypothetical protein